MTQIVNRSEFSARPLMAARKPVVKRLAGAIAMAGLLLLSACPKTAKAISTPFFSPTGDRTAFTLASTNLQTANFEGAPTGGFLSVNPRVEQGVTFTGSNALFLVDEAAPGGFFNYGTGDSLLVGDGAAPANIFLTAALPANITAVGFDYATRSGTANSFIFTINETMITQNFTFTSSQFPARAFFGVTSTTPITSLRVALMAPTEQFLIDRFSIGQANVAAVPEPGTITLMGLGLAGLIGASRRKKKAQEAASEAV